jgi:hypothetical protein
MLDRSVTVRKRTGDLEQKPPRDDHGTLADNVRLQRGTQRRLCRRFELVAGKAGKREKLKRTRRQLIFPRFSRLKRALTALRMPIKLCSETDGFKRCLARLCLCMSSLRGDSSDVVLSSCFNRMVAILLDARRVVTRQCPPRRRALVLKPTRPGRY